MYPPHAFCHLQHMVLHFSDPALKIIFCFKFELHTKKKLVGGKIICIHTTCFACATGCFNNMKQDTIIYLLVE